MTDTRLLRWYLEMVDGTPPSTFNRLPLAAHVKFQALMLACGVATSTALTTICTWTTTSATIPVREETSAAALALCGPMSYQARFSQQNPLLSSKITWRPASLRVLTHLICSFLASPWSTVAWILHNLYVAFDKSVCQMNHVNVNKPQLCGQTCQPVNYCSHFYFETR